MLARPTPEPEQPETPPPLGLSEADFERVAAYIEKSRGERQPNERLLAEILDCLRAIDDKLERLLDARRHLR